MRSLSFSLLLTGLACAPAQLGPRTPEVSPMTELSSLFGTAGNAKGGAVLEADDGRVVYVVGLDSWPDELLGQRVTATGRLERRKYIPDPVVAEDGAISQGAVGDQWVLDDAAWNPDEPVP